MLTFNVLSALLSYPEAETIAALDEMVVILNQENVLSETAKQALFTLIDSYRDKDLLVLQEDYVALFDRGRFLSLHIFEHVHGESRDRGQAMVNLLQMYEAQGFELTSQELPDYIPLLLEFLSQQTPEQASSLLRDAMPVLSLLGARLKERANLFHLIFDALENFAGEPEDLASIHQQAATEGEDETLVNMDDIWEEEAVTFMNTGEQCQSQTATINPNSIKRMSR